MASVDSVRSTSLQQLLPAGTYVARYYSDHTIVPGHPISRLYINEILHYPPPESGTVYARMLAYRANNGQWSTKHINPDLFAISSQDLCRSGQNPIPSQTGIGCAFPLPPVSPILKDFKRFTNH